MIRCIGYAHQFSCLYALDAALLGATKASLSLAAPSAVAVVGHCVYGHLQLDSSVSDGEACLSSLKFTVLLGVALADEALFRLLCMSQLDIFAGGRIADLEASCLRDV
jgi:hypothetical protein